jgi:hypothetical protein
VKTARGQGPPPPMLQLAWWCGTSHLPEPGGLFDQDYRTFYQMMAAKNVHDTVQYSRSLVGKDIEKLTVGQRQTIRYLKELRIM